MPYKQYNPNPTTDPVRGIPKGEMGPPVLTVPLGSDMSKYFSPIPKNDPIGQLGLGLENSFFKKKQPQTPFVGQLNGQPNSYLPQYTTPSSFATTNAPPAIAPPPSLGAYPQSPYQSQFSYPTSGSLGFYNRQ